MSQKAPSAPKSRRKSTRSRKRVLLGGSRYSKRQLAVGVGGTLLVHVWLALLVSWGVFDVEPMESVDRYKEYSIELSDVVEEDEPDQVYTQTNPDVPDNEPDETNRVSSRNQQAANEERPEELDPEERPANESEDNIETEQVISGDLNEAVAAPPPGQQPNESESEQQEQQEQSEQAPAPNQPLLQLSNPSESTQRKEIPLFGSQEEAEDDSGLADHVYEELEEPPTNVTDYLEGEEDEGEAQADSPASPAVDPSQSTPMAVQSVDGVPSPRARPKLPRVAAAPTRDSRLGVTNTGKVAVDAKASKFGEYMERLIETVSLNWDDLIERSSSVERKSVVKIRFILNRYGIVEDIEVLEGTTSRVLGIHMCREAIQRGVPFGPWPQGLVDMFGENEDITFTFHYY